MEEAIWPHISGVFKILFLWNPRIGLISWRVTPDMPMEREIESLNVKNEVKKNNNLFSFHFFLQRRAETFCQYAGTAWVLNFQSNQVKHTCAFDTKTAISHIQSGWHFAANQRVAIHGCEKCRYLWSVRKKPPCHLIRFWQHVHDQNVCYWIICSN